MRGAMPPPPRLHRAASGGGGRVGGGWGGKGGTCAPRLSPRHGHPAGDSPPPLAWRRVRHVSARTEDAADFRGRVTNRPVGGTKRRTKPAAGEWQRGMAWGGGADAAGARRPPWPIRPGPGICACVTRNAQAAHTSPFSGASA
eukprot:scaffold849_cov386-Prasinococcus_capsulatus_cf.AAC.4